MNKIKELRKENNITVAELAKELGISQSMLTNYENGNGTPRDDSIWDRLSQLFGVSKSHVMGLTTDIDVVHRKKKFKAVVDMSEPISIQVENQTDIDILTKLDLLDDEDTNKVLDFINNLLTIKKYEGIEDSPIEYVTSNLRRPLAQPTRRPVRNRRSGHPSERWFLKEHEQERTRCGKYTENSRQHDCESVVCYSFS